MKKGAPSVNPEGPRVSKRSTQAVGYDGVVAYGGYLETNESDSDLRGTRRWTTFANMRRRPPVAVWGRLRSALVGGISWTATENEAGGPDAVKGKEIVEQGLLKARLGTGPMARPFSAVASKAIGGAGAYGHDVHATAMGRRKDGVIVYTDIAHRGQHTINRWLREVEHDESTPFVAIEQLTKTGQKAILDLNNCLYVVNDNGTNTDSPAGAGMLELIAERVRRLNVYEPLEGTELASSMGGIPVTRVPLSEMKQTLAGKMDQNATDFAAKLQLAVDTRLAKLRDFVTKRFKDPTKLPWFELDSATYEGSDPNTITGIKKYDIEIIKGDLQGLTEMRKIISDLDLDIARMLGIEFVFVGGGDTAGSFGMHESKVTAFAAALNSEVGLFAYDATNQLARALCAANGLDPDTACPTLVPSPVMRTDVLRAVDAISKLNMAGLPKNHPAKKAVFEAVDLPWQEEDESEDMAPRAFGGFGGFGGRKPADEPGLGTEKEPAVLDDKKTEDKKEPVT
jgi:hypothetical protein